MEKDLFVANQSISTNYLTSWLCWAVSWAVATMLDKLQKSMSYWPHRRMTQDNRITAMLALAMDNVYWAHDCRKNVNSNQPWACNGTNFRRNDSLEKNLVVGRCYVARSTEENLRLGTRIAFQAKIKIWFTWVDATRCWINIIYVLSRRWQPQWNTHTRTDKRAIFYSFMVSSLICRKKVAVRTHLNSYLILYLGI